ncbi:MULTISPECIES: hypothetical protein [Halobacterium]|uniref:ATP phosphoribosyltransferase n=4 Tax=Halobacterium salinarum TaxID=2242 RepID=Q9HR61_HALSA|nr:MULTISPECIES: hypothetical protein [Halobacterium]AAG19297.1 hypothetical protein VNG_0847H [Halobacterium salinarum NRC-1]MBB6090411.1 hypothetical protein [Halobacterium salinarum]MCF2166351.1 hypothetical protein [Halobacterium salinarum]MCF2168142.1 hypothetical protein [Halobacterium salinarum]MCF2237805.1 hypothetical protein [Halobacterium salinarum]
MTPPPVRIAVPRKGRPLEAVLDRVGELADAASVADDIATTLRYEKGLTKGDHHDARGVYERLAAYSTPDEPTAPDYTLLRDSRVGKPRRIVFDSLTVTVAGTRVELIGREEPFRALRTHEFALGFDSADLVLEEVVGLRPEPLTSIADVNERIDPVDTDVRVASGLGDTVYHTLLATPDAHGSAGVDRAFLDAYSGPVCISPRYERLVEAVLGTAVTEGLTFTYPDADHDEEEAAIADAGVGVYLTVTGSTARDHGLTVGEQLFPSETVLMENQHEATGERVASVRQALTTAPTETAIPPQ